LLYKFIIYITLFTLHHINSNGVLYAGNTIKHILPNR